VGNALGATDRLERKVALELELQFEEALAFLLWSRGVLEALRAKDAYGVATALGYLMEAELILERLGYEEDIAKLQEDRVLIAEQEKGLAASGTA
jgi:hypothetical protein